MRESEDFDIARNIRDMEAMKCSLLAGVSEVFQLMQDSGAAREAMGEALAGIMFTSMELAGRLGVTVDDLDRRVTRRIRAKRLGTGAV